MKCTMASICAVTDRTIKDALSFPPTREIADACFKEVLAVAKAKGYDLGEDYLTQAFAYLEKVGIHKDSMCVDIANRTRTGNRFFGGKGRGIRKRDRCSHALLRHHGQSGEGHGRQVFGVALKERFFCS